jgi:hypothetical protein
MRAVEISEFFLDNKYTNSILTINNYNIETKQMSTLKIIQETNLYIEDENTINIKVHSNEEMAHMRRFIVYKVVVDKDEEFYLREQLNSIIKK